MEADDLLCSRNARPPKALVGHAQWKITAPIPEEIMSEFGRINSIGGGRLMCAGGDGTGSVSTLNYAGLPLRVKQLEQTA